MDSKSFEQQPNGDVAAALNAGTALAGAIKNPHEDSAAFVLVPDGHIVQYLQREGTPFRKHGSVKFSDVASFIAYWAQQSAPGSRIYGSLEPAQFVAVFNDHHTSADWKDYRALYKLKHSKEWLTWADRDRKDFAGNDAFAIWLEDNAIDVSTPDPATMMDIALNMRVSQSQGFSKALRLQDGNIQFSYNNVVEANATPGQVSIPETFQISIPVFEGMTAARYSVQAKFRYRLKDSALIVRYELVRPHKIVEQAFEDLVKKISDETSKTVLFGTPE